MPVGIVTYAELKGKILSEVMKNLEHFHGDFFEIFLISSIVSNVVLVPPFFVPSHTPCHTQHQYFTHFDKLINMTVEFCQKLLFIHILRF